MRKLLLQSNGLGHWRDLIQEAQSQVAKPLNEECESYLAFLLMGFMEKVSLAEQVVALDHLKSAGMTGQAQQALLREVGDTCLMLSGLFPGRAEKRHVSVNYYVDMGQQAYGNLSTLSHSLADLYATLQRDFVNLMNILHAIRGFTEKDLGLSVLQAEQLWERTEGQVVGARLKSSLNGVDLAALNKIGRVRH